MRIIFIFFFGILPSLIWLGWFLREDVHPEPKREISLVFLFGMLIALLAAFLETVFVFPLKFLPGMVTIVLGTVLITPIVEEYLKFFVVKKVVISNSVFDEPMDIPIYMITAALGFAAVENIFLLVPFISPFQIHKILVLSSTRFISATFLHAISSGFLGVFISYSFYKLRKRKIYFSLGLLLAILLHSFYNFYIIEARDFKGVLILFLISISFLLFFFKRLRKMPPVCKIKL